MPREDFIPAIFTVDKNNRLLGLEVVVCGPELLFFLFARALSQLTQACAQLAQDRAIMVRDHALLNRPAMYHQVTALALVDTVCTDKFINFHLVILLL